MGEVLKHHYVNNENGILDSRPFGKSFSSDCESHRHNEVLKSCKVLEKLMEIWFLT